MEEGLARHEDTAGLTHLSPVSKVCHQVEDGEVSLQSLLSVQVQIQSKVSQLIVGEESKRIVSDMTDVQKKYQQLIDKLLKLEVQDTAVQGPATVTFLDPGVMEQKQQSDVHKERKDAVEEIQSLVTRIQLSTSVLHLITWKDETWVISNEVSRLQLAWRGYDLVATVLAKRSNTVFKVENLTARKEELLWRKLVSAEVGGLVGRGDDPVDQLSMYRLADLLDILDTLHIELGDLDMEMVRSAVQTAAKL